MLAAKDANAAPAEGAPRPKATIVSGDDLISLLQRPEAKGAAPGATLSLASLKPESQHEVVALLPGSRLLTINYSNWNRLRSEGSAETPTLVISFLGACPTASWWARRQPTRHRTPSLHLPTTPTTPPAQATLRWARATPFASSWAPARTGRWCRRRATARQRR
jgi:hypothetical protein